MQHTYGEQILFFISWMCVESLTQMKDVFIIF